MGDQSFHSVVGALHELRLCARCILRFIDERSPSSYEGAYQDIARSVSKKYGIEFKSCTDGDRNSNSIQINDNNGDATDDDDDDGDDNGQETAKSTKSANTCTSCLGILKEQCNTTVIKKIEEEVINSGFEFEGFTFSVSLPLCLLVRQITCHSLGNVSLLCSRLIHIKVSPQVLPRNKETIPKGMERDLKWENIMPKHSLFLYLKEKFSDLYSDKISVDGLPSIKEVFKWVCGPALGTTLGVFFQHESSFQILIKFGYEKGNEELEFLTEVDPSRFKERKTKRRAPAIPMFSVTSIRKALDDLETAEQLRKYTYCPPSFSSYKSYCAQVVCSHSSILLAGRYNKYSRTLPQTPWIIDGERMLESSVQERICDILLSKIKADDCKFSSGGREDIDVRMLGTGRPFVVEFLNPHKTIPSQEFLAAVQKEINSSAKDIKIRDLQFVTNCLVWTEKEISESDLVKLSEIKDLKLQQKTPLRVLHRRPLAVREKVVYNMSTEYKDSHHFRLYLKTMAGTYVKEFVHGDFGRTKPNIGSILGSDADILELDVESVDVNWPPSLESTPAELSPSV